MPKSEWAWSRNKHELVSWSGWQSHCSYIKLETVQNKQNNRGKRTRLVLRGRAWRLLTTGRAQIRGPATVTSRSSVSSSSRSERQTISAAFSWLHTVCWVLEKQKTCHQVSRPAPPPPTPPHVIFSRHLSNRCAWARYRTNSSKVWFQGDVLWKMDFGTAWAHILHLPFFSKTCLRASRTIPTFAWIVTSVHTFFFGGGIIFEITVASWLALCKETHLHNMSPWSPEVERHQSLILDKHFFFFLSPSQLEDTVPWDTSFIHSTIRLVTQNTDSQCH